MSLDSALRALRMQLQHLRDSAQAARLTLVEDRPGDVALVDQRGSRVDDLLGWIEEAVQLARRAEGACKGAGDFQKVRRSLGPCHERVNRMNCSMSDELLSYECVAELAGIARSRGGAWAAWAKGVQDGLRQCQQLLFDVNDALLSCWRELSDRLSAGGVHVRATSVGQRITVSDGSERAADTGRE